MKSKDKCPPWPEQAGWMRVQCCLTVLEPFFKDRDAYLAVRREVFLWDVGDEGGKASERARANQNARWAKEKKDGS